MSAKTSHDAKWTALAAGHRGLAPRQSGGRRSLAGPLMALAALLAAGGGPGGADAAESPRAGSPPAVVVELFTSQGCSSCPPADRLLSRLGREAREDGVILVPLAFHVDYWNRIGWVDPFSSSRWSARQRRYGERFGLRSVYTPQAVVDGRAELVGSRASGLRAAIAESAARRETGRVEIRRAALAAGGAELVVEVDAQPGAGAGANTVVNLALFESGLVTPVESGENSGRTLGNDYVVRLLRPLMVLAPGGPRSRSERATVALDPGWTVDRLGVAVFLQDAESLEIGAATAIGRLASVATRKRSGGGDAPAGAAR